MLSETKLTVLKSEIKSFSREELVWFNGYISGLLSQNGAVEIPEAPTPGTTIKPSIIYGTETGNSKKLAFELQSLLKKNKIQSRVFDAGQYAVSNIEKETFIILIISTQGEGEVPENARSLVQKLSQQGLSLPDLRYAVLALGDRSYPLFCKAGEDADLLLSDKGATRVLPLQKTDTDYEETAGLWFNDLLSVLQNYDEKKVALPDHVLSKKGSSKKEYEGVVHHKVILNDNGSNKQTYHIEIRCNDEVGYEPGDAVGFYPYNSEHDAKAVARLLKNEARFEELRKRNIKGLGKIQLQALSALLDVSIKEERSDLEDILKKYVVPDTVGFNEVLDLLHPVSPRLYSISSSPEAHAGELHITVNHHRFDAGGSIKSGFCSQFLGDLEPGAPLSFYIHKNRHFRLPPEDSDVIMIGPGTGIAPFRSFLAHRDATATAGRNWLFFGEQHFVTDFYYQTEIQQWLATGVLTKLDTAFSRDQKHKVYVQHRIKEQAEELVSWIENGAYVYVCGQKNPMSRDVEDALKEAVSLAKGLNTAGAAAYIERLEQQGRYIKDVY